MNVSSASGLCPRVFFARLAYVQNVGWSCHSMQTNWWQEFQEFSARDEFFFVVAKTMVGSTPLVPKYNLF